MPPALRELCEAVIVIGASFKYWFAAFNIRCRSRAARLKVVCWAATDQQKSRMTKRIETNLTIIASIIRRLIGLTSAALPQHSAVRLCLTGHPGFLDEATPQPIGRHSLLN